MKRLTSAPRADKRRDTLNKILLPLCCALLTACVAFFGASGRQAPAPQRTSPAEDAALVYEAPTVPAETAKTAMETEVPAAEDPAPAAAAAPSPAAADAAAPSEDPAQVQIAPASPEEPLEPQISGAENGNMTAAFTLENAAGAGVRTRAGQRTFVITPNGVYGNSLSSPTETVVYQFTLTERGVLRYGIATDVTEDADWRVRLYQEYYVNGNYGETAMRTLDELEYAAGSASAASTGIGLAPGNYELRVSAGSRFSTFAYHITMDFTPSLEYEIEYNNTRTRYTELYADRPMRGSASYIEGVQDEDWFLLRVYYAGAYQIVFTHPDCKLNTVAFKISLFTEDMKELYSDNSLMNSTGIGSGLIGLPAGVYYIQVQARVYADCDYTLSVQSAYEDCETEPNDAPALATPIKSGKPLYGALSPRAGSADKDYYKFTLPAPGTVEITLKNTDPVKEGKGYVRRLLLADALGHPVLSMLLADDADGIAPQKTGLAAGDYYLVVNNADLYQDNGGYQISYTYTPDDAWEREYNNLDAWANDLAPDTPVTGTITDHGSVFDEDWFAFTLNEACAVEVRLSHEALEGEADIFAFALYNGALERVGEQTVSFANAAEVSARYDLQPGVYYVKVTSGRYSPSIPYTLSYTIPEE